MGTVTRLAAVAESVTLRQALSAYLTTLAGWWAGRHETGVRARPAPRGTRIRCRLPVADLETDAFAAWFTGQWAERAPATAKGR